MRLINRVLVAITLIAAAVSCGQVEQSAAQDQEHPFPIKFVDVEEGQIAYREGGNPEGEVVLFSHGAFMADSFLRLFDEPALADYRLILVHRRGYGESTDYEGVIPLALQAEDLASLLRQLNVEQAHVIGHSGGVPPVVALASMYPDRVQSLMRLEGGGPPIAGAPPPSQANMEGFARVNEAMQQALQMEPAQQARALFQGLVGDGWEAEVTKYFPGAIEQVAADFAMTVTQDLPGLQVPVDAEFYESITQPIASVFSENAPYLDAFQPREMRQTWEVSPQTEFRFLPGMGHEMMIVHPEPVAELIADWLAENPIE